MTLFFFHLHNADTIIPDSRGQRLAGVAEARDAAIEAARGIMAENVLAGHLNLSGTIAVESGTGDAVLRMPFREAIAIDGLDEDGDRPAAQPIPYEHPRRIWVEDGHVFVEGHDGATLKMIPEVALNLSRQLGTAGSESLINKVMDRN